MNLSNNEADLLYIINSVVHRKGNALFFDVIPMQSLANIPHRDLSGSNRLYNLVTCLGESCPWTKQMKANDMITFLESEVHELREELSRAKISREAIISELGDILFDTLMLEMLLRKEINFGVNEAWEAAARKVERRTPYMKQWGDGSILAETMEEAEAIWKSVKRKEKEENTDGNISSGLNHLSVDVTVSTSQEINESNLIFLASSCKHIFKNIPYRTLKSHSLSFIGGVMSALLGFYGIKKKT